MRFNEIDLGRKHAVSNKDYFRLQTSFVNQCVTLLPKLDKNIINYCSFALKTASKVQF